MSYYPPKIFKNYSVIILLYKNIIMYIFINIFKNYSVIILFAGNITMTGCYIEFKNYSVIILSGGGWIVFLIIANLKTTQLLFYKSSRGTLDS